jgi:hypothetical protein
MHRGLPSAQLATIHDIIMDQEEALSQLESTGSIDNGLAILTTCKPMPDDHQDRAQALPWAPGKIAYHPNHIYSRRMNNGSSFFPTGEVPLQGRVDLDAVIIKDGIYHNTLTAPSSV